MLGIRTERVVEAWRVGQAAEILDSGETIKVPSYAEWPRIDSTVGGNMRLDDGQIRADVEAVMVCARSAPRLDGMGHGD